MLTKRPVGRSRPGRRRADAVRIAAVLSGGPPLRTVAVFVGGACGGVARYGVATALASSSSRFPLATLVVNCSGAFGLGLAAVLLTERMPPTRYLRAFVGIGFFGAYTTFSTMAVEGIRLLDAGDAATALAYWIATLVFGQMAAVCGMWLGRLRFDRSREGSDDARA